MGVRAIAQIAKGSGSYATKVFSGEDLGLLRGRPGGLPLPGGRFFRWL
jgi:hypothetical protein